MNPCMKPLSTKKPLRITERRICDPAGIQTLLQKQTLKYIKETLKAFFKQQQT